MAIPTSTKGPSKPTSWSINGETVVLGGVFERNRFTSKEQVPWLGNLPILGNLFKNDSRKETNNELLIFVTPRILQPELKPR